MTYYMNNPYITLIETNNKVIIVQISFGARFNNLQRIPTDCCELSFRVQTRAQRNMKCPRNIQS